jgi:hypothetical protein
MRKIVIVLVLAAFQVGANLALQPLFDASKARGYMTCDAGCI